MTTPEIIERLSYLANDLKQEFYFAKERSMRDDDRYFIGSSMAYFNAMTSIESLIKELKK